MCCAKNEVFFNGQCIADMLVDGCIEYDGKICTKCDPTTTKYIKDSTGEVFCCASGKIPLSIG
jgi:hypothetical protein